MQLRYDKFPWLKQVRYIFKHDIGIIFLKIYMFLFQQPEPVLAQLKEFGPQPKAGRMQCIQICSRIQYVLTYDDIVYMFGLPQKPQRYA